MKILLETQRLIFREINIDDLDNMFKLDSDEQVHTYLDNNPINTYEEAAETISFIQNQYIANGIGRWALVAKETNSFIGWAGLKLITEPINNKINYYDLGYRLLKDYWGRGYATEAAKALIAYGFDILGLQDIYAMANIENLASVKILKKAGLLCVEEFEFQKVGHYFFRISKT